MVSANSPETLFRLKSSLFLLYHSSGILRPKLKGCDDKAALVSNQ
jgi:hypothetical protein